MFSNLLFSKPQRRTVRSPAWGVSVVVHALAVVLAVNGASRLNEQRGPAVFEAVTFMDIAPEPERVEEPKPEPEPEAAAPEPAPEVTRPELPAGYQVLAAPEEMVGIPAPGLVEIRAEDFTGRGIAGGVGGGLPLKLAPTTPRAPEVEAPMSVAVVDEPPRVSNAAEIASRMEELYPMTLRMAGVGGQVVIQLVVDAKGFVETKGDTIVSSSHRELDRPTRELARIVRFEPARRNGNPVRVWVRLPVTWSVD